MPLDLNAKADEFVARVQSANITPSTDVVLIYHLVDIATGRLLPPTRSSVVGTTTAKGMTPEKRAAFARQVHLDTIIGNINSVVRSCPATPFTMRETGSLLVTLRDIEMEIVEES